AARDQLAHARGRRRAAAGDDAAREPLPGRRLGADRAAGDDRGGGAGGPRGGGEGARGTGGTRPRRGGAARGRRLSLLGSDGAGLPGWSSESPTQARPAAGRASEPSRRGMPPARRLGRRAGGKCAGAYQSPSRRSRNAPLGEPGTVVVVVVLGGQGFGVQVAEPEGIPPC